MDYKQKYVQALERARIWKEKSGMPVNKQGILDDIFPELKESEDEKIRKSLINYINYYGNAGDFTKQEFIAWIKKQHEEKLLNNDKYQTVSVEILDRLYESEKELERLKQGEKKLQCSSALEVWKDMRLEIYQQASGNRHEPNYSDDSTKMFSLTDIDEIFEKVAEKQGEQKPVDKVESKFKVGDCIRHKGVDECYKIVTIDENYYFCENNHAWNIRSQDYFELVEQKPAEWSEEDENLLNHSLENLTELKNRFGEKYGKVGECIYWLKSLKERMKGE